MKIKVDRKVKACADEKQLVTLLSALDFTNYIQFRDAVSIIMIYRTGIRVSTLVKLEEKHIGCAFSSSASTKSIISVISSIPNVSVILYKR
ncbi:hypothetical protein [Lysinibacillus xylanilyticus]|uniref:hypothetical protein n=1 Tax=Lysinibacillus xylanilyticus TaxID=582475 RepID=UPI003819C9E1